MVDRNELIPENSVTLQFPLYGSTMKGLLDKGHAGDLGKLGVTRYYLWNNTDDITFELGDGVDKKAVAGAIERMTREYMDKFRRSRLEQSK